MGAGTVCCVGQCRRAGGPLDIAKDSPVANKLYL